MSRLQFIRDLVAKRGYNPSMTKKDGLENLIKGENCDIQEGVIIGMDGFGYEQNEFGVYEKFPHYGKIILGDNVDVYAPTVLIRGSVHDTEIGNGTKIAGNCQIGHNCKIGKNCLIGPFVCVGGTSDIGDNVKIGQFVYIAHGIKIGSNCRISSFTMVTKDIPAGSKIRGIPGELI